MPGRAFTYNDPVIFHEYAIDVALACRERGVKSVAVTAGYVCPAPRAEFYAHMDAANVDLKAFTERFYHKVCAAHLEPVLETLLYLKHETDVWFELTTLLIPGENDSDEEIDAMTGWVVERLGPEVPMHFTAFHPDWKMMDRPPTPPSTLRRARGIALRNGVRYAYVGNVRDRDGGSTYCHACGQRLIERDGYSILGWGRDGGRGVPALWDPDPGSVPGRAGSLGEPQEAGPPPRLRGLISSGREGLGAVADHPVPAAHRVARVPQIQPPSLEPSFARYLKESDDGHAAAGLVIADSGRVQSLDGLGRGLIQLAGDRAALVMAEVGADHDERLGPAPESVEDLRNTFGLRLADDHGDDGEVVEHDLEKR